tara:strand:- start:142 stop:369 length:228 start_codon:yes stop_codon:yes gene_type:complete
MAIGMPYSRDSPSSIEVNRPYSGLPFGNCFGIVATGTCIACSGSLGLDGLGLQKHVISLIGTYKTQGFEKKDKLL